MIGAILGYDGSVRIADKYGTTVAAIAEANGITHLDLILVGQRLITPAQEALQTPTIALAPMRSTVAALRPITGHALLAPMSHDSQKWNNCAPTAASMALS